MSGRGVAGLLDGQVGYLRVNQVLADLAAAGIVLRESHPPAYAYWVNRDHVAVAAIEILSDLRGRVMERIVAAVSGWAVQPVAVWLFGSAARGSGGLDSDIDLLVLRPDCVEEDDPTWRQQLDVVTDKVSLWSGNDCQILEYSETELEALVASGERLVAELRQDALVLTATSLQAVLRTPTLVG